MSEHTKTPWTASAPDGSYHDVIRIYSGDNRDLPVAVCPQMKSAVLEVISGSTDATTEGACNAAFIVRACNSHEALKEFAEWVLKIEPENSLLAINARHALKSIA